MTAHASTPFERVTIVGLGLIGGSIAKGLRACCPSVHLLAVDRSDVGKRPDVEGVIDTFIDVAAAPTKQALLRESDLIVLCQPVRIIAESLPDYLGLGVAVTDTGSTKRHLARRAAGCAGASLFVPSHPMAGKAQGGFENATPELFLGRPWIVCGEGRMPHAVSRVEALATCLGAHPVAMTPEDHDAAVAVVSHAPQLLASWLQMAGTRSHASAVAGPAYADMTRVAGGAESIWRDIFETNADEVGKVLREGARVLDALAEALLASPPRLEPVLELLARARVARTAEPGAPQP